MYTHVVNGCGKPEFILTDWVKRVVCKFADQRENAGEHFKSSIGGVSNLWSSRVHRSHEGDKEIQRHSSTLPSPTHEHRNVGYWPSCITNILKTTERIGRQSIANWVENWQESVWSPYSNWHARPDSKPCNICRGASQDNSEITDEYRAHIIPLPTKAWQCSPDSWRWRKWELDLADFTQHTNLGSRSETHLDPQTFSIFVRSNRTRSLVSWLACFDLRIFRIRLTVPASLTLIWKSMFDHAKIKRAQEAVSCTPGCLACVWSASFNRSIPPEAWLA